MELAGSRTERNLLVAFAGESQARNRYTFFAGVAKKEGLEQMAAIFEETANQEKEHAKKFFSFLKTGSAVEITESFPAGKIGTTMDNLLAAADGEHHEWSEMYPEFAKIAKEEGFTQIAKIFEEISVAEKHHEKRYRHLYDSLKAGKVFQRENKVIWRCRNCGYIHEAETAPKACPACQHPQSYFEVAYEPWLDNF